LKVVDVIVVGAGPAGSALATLLGRDGYDVLLLEKARFPRDKVCGDLVSSKGLKFLADLGCYDEIATRGYFPIRESLVFLDDRLLSRGELPHLPGHPPCSHAIPRVELDDVVFRCAAKAGVTTIEGCAVQGVESSPSGVVVDAVVGGRRFRFFGRLVVGADGAASIVARSTGHEVRDPRYVQLAIRAYCEGLPFERASLLFAEEFFPGYAWIFPITATRANIGVGMVKESVQRGGIRLRLFYERLVAFLRRQAEELGVEIEISRPAGWPIKTYGGAKRNFFEHGLLIGEAGCFVDPISGEGIPLAFETASMAADTIRGAFASGEFGAAALAGYERRWRSAYDADLAVSDLVVSLIRNRQFVKVWTQWLRVMGMTALRDRDYARKVGGVLAGLVPNREVLSPDVVLKSFLHGPRFWMEAFDLSAANPLRDLVERGVRMAQWERSVAASIADDLTWFGDWALEVGAKQLSVLRSTALRR
jgi:geranylgeranyl reductase family protein